MDKELLLTSAAFPFFIICPRMAGMIHVIGKNSNLPLIRIVFLGAVMSIPLILLMIWIFSKSGITGALLFCIVTDFISAILLSNISIKAGLETIVIALFVLAGVKIAPIISTFLNEFFQ